MNETPNRRTVLRGAGIVGAGVLTAGTLVACGDDSASSSVSQAGKAAGDAAGKATDAIKTAVDQASIPVGGGKIIDEVVITQPTEGTFKAFSAVCTHQKCLVSSVANGEILCSCHDSVFDAASGEVISGPASSPLPEKSISLTADGITVN